MGTYDFVKETGRDRYWELLQKEKRAMIDPKTGMLRKDLARRVDCPVCGKCDSQHVFVKDGFNYVKCIKCGILYINPQLDDDALKQRYRGASSQDWWVEVLQTAPQLKYDTKKFRGAVKDLETHAEKGKLLDVGCSIGVFLDIARRRGWDAVGVELGRKARRVAVEKFGLAVHDKPLDELDLEPGSFDVVTLWEVLEHLQEPRKILTQCHRLMKKKGTIVILVPNANSLAVRMLRDRAATFGWGHLWYFTPEALEKMLRDIGFVPYHVGTELGEMDTISNYLQFDDPYIKGKTSNVPSPYKFSKEMKKTMNSWIVRNGLGYKLRVYARKR
ncbi:MAG: class I SAM-dependent methyltransferase [bacterium]